MHRFEVKMKKEREGGGGGKYHLVSTNLVQSTLQPFLICDEILNLKKRGNKWC